MFSLIIKQVFIVSLNFNISLTTACLSLSDEPCMVRATLIDLSPIELKHSSLMVSQDIRSGSCNSGNDLSTKMCVPSETEDRNVNAFNIIANKNEAKTLLKHISCDFKCKFTNLQILCFTKSNICLGC